MYKELFLHKNPLSCNTNSLTLFRSSDKFVAHFIQSSYPSKIFLYGTEVVGVINFKKIKMSSENSRCPNLFIKHF